MPIKNFLILAFAFALLFGGSIAITAQTDLSQKVTKNREMIITLQEQVRAHSRSGPHDGVDQRLRALEIQNALTQATVATNNSLLIALATIAGAQLLAALGYLVKDKVAALGAGK